MTPDQKRLYLALLRDTQNDLEITLHMHTRGPNVRIDRLIGNMKDLTAMLIAVVSEA